MLPMKDKIKYQKKRTKQNSRYLYYSFFAFVFGICRTERDSDSSRKLC